MGHRQEQEEYERSLSEWRVKLRGSLAARRAQEQNLSSTPPPSLPYTPQYAYGSTKNLSISPNESRASRKPLIEKVTNTWRDDRVPTGNAFTDDEDRRLRFCDLEDETSCPNVTYELVGSRRFRRMFMVGVACLTVFYWAWKWYLQPRFAEEWDFKEGFLHDKLNGTYGIAQTGDFEGVRIKQIDSHLVPGDEADRDGKRRLVFVGDIHGCADELANLLAKVAFDTESDHLITVGDVISKGPDNLRVLDELIRLNADSVRGNHEDRLLEAARTVLNMDLPPQSAASTSKGFSKDAALLKELPPQHIKYLKDMPLMLRIPVLPHASTSFGKESDCIAHEIIVTHAGLVAAVPLAKQDPYFVLNMRTIQPTTHVPSASRTGKDGRNRPWHELWNWYNDRLYRGRSLKGFMDFDVITKHGYDIPRKSWLSKVWTSAFGTWEARPEPQVVVYGHDSKAGLQIHPWSKGLDSACVAGGNLTALVMDAKGKTEIVGVQCKDYKT